MRLVANHVEGVTLVPVWLVLLAQETVHHLDKEESRLTQELRALSAELEEVKGQNTRDDPSVITYYL